MSRADGKKNQSQLQNLGRVWRLLFRQMPGSVFLVILCSVLLSFRNPIELIFQKNIVDKTVQTTSSGFTLSALLPVFLGYIAFELFSIVLISTFPALRNYWTGIAGRRFNNLVIEKSGRLSAELYQKAEYQENINKASQISQQAGAVCFNGISALFMIFFSAVLLAGYLASMNIWLILAVALTVLPDLLRQHISSKEEVRLTHETEPFKRETAYYFSCITSKAYFKETRLLGCADYFKDLWKNALEQVNRKTLGLHGSLGKMNASMQAIAWIGQGFCLVIAIFLLFQKKITLGEYTVVLTASRMLTSHFQDVVGFMGWIFHSSRQFQLFLSFLDEKEPESLPSYMGGDIVLKNVSYRYHNSPKNALENISFHIRSGEKIAVVGKNGSGKTTLSKLILGIYQPAQGTVGFQDAEGKICPYTEKNSEISAVFQDYMKYQLTVRENVAISRISEQANDEKIVQALKYSCVYDQLNQTPDFLENMTGREFGGIELSQGQWQSVAIARGYFRGGKLLILDEPTASIDPLKESAIFQNFLEAAKGKTALIITHRLGMAKLADRIIVMENGRMVQQGTHKELICQKEGAYRELFVNQSDWFEQTENASFAGKK